MYFHNALMACIAVAALSAAAPVASPAPNSALPQVYGAHLLKMKEDDFKKVKREEAFPQVYGAHLLKMKEDDFKKVKRDAEGKALSQVYGAHLLKMAEDDF
ncbi:hypothetical protein BR93DRAFT_934716 [Coniochaeta sp. PMI_546]|nr:hypothetical protein BR93DRAFT_934716 [Coniochaeta sp. PMI_546]